MMQRVVVITGAFGVLGSAVARAAKAGGSYLALIDVAAEPPAALKAELGEEVLWLGGVDLTSAEGAKGAVEAVLQRFGRLDALLNVAGGFRWTALADSTPDDWSLLFRINVQTAANISRAAADSLKASGSGRIVNVGAGAAERAAAGMGAYTAAKAGVHKLTESLAEELKGTGVTVNAVLPSIIDTPQNRADMPDADPKAWVTTAELAAVMLFLASEAASGVTGALVRVPGRV
ncbi:MAG: SDR family NAD(P)-dependent oxidoreductase [Caulobacteraceae bacterium]|nr:SDR family NAD(P)-dependent oxidoreductase [Caulobacteraceae bacterium]